MRYHSTHLCMGPMKLLWAHKLLPMIRDRLHQLATPLHVHAPQRHHLGVVGCLSEGFQAQKQTIGPAHCSIPQFFAALQGVHQCFCCGAKSHPSLGIGRAGKDSMLRKLIDKHHQKELQGYQDRVLSHGVGLSEILSLPGRHHL